MQTRCWPRLRLLDRKLTELLDKTDSAGAAAREVLLTPVPARKVMAARAATRAWRKEHLTHQFVDYIPDVPARPDRPELLRPGQMPRRGKGTSVTKRIALIHALAHIEFVAIDLAYDMIARFGSQFPAEFCDDWFRVGAEEAMHFVLLDRRLREMGSFYGQLPAHDGLWDAARDTAHDSSARLAIVPMVLEARGLDITLATVERFKEQGDPLTAKVLNRIYNDEITHVSYGTKWFEWVCKNRKSDPHSHWKNLVKTHFKGGLKPPFNDSARRAAGLTRDYYIGIE